MNNKKICFIICVNNEIYFEQCVFYLNNLIIPDGYEIDIISIRDGETITSAYNQAMKTSDAKYKVYIHQDTFILNKNFINDIIEIFNKDEEIGMIGMVGAKTIPMDGCWWNSKNCCGTVYENSTGVMNKLQFKKEDEYYSEVKAIDGLLMCTQYDIKWREDIFNGWHLYDTSQSLEFLRKGYKVVVPNVNEPWVLHDCGLVKFSGGNYEGFKDLLLKEYKNEIYPLVSVLIPTYNRPDYFKVALESVINQTYPRIEIIIGDDSVNNDTEVIVKEYMEKYDNIRYYHNKKNIGQFDNDLKLMELSNGRYVNYLMDDDIFYINKIEKMMSIFIEDINNEISLVSSNREVINSKGESIRPFIIGKDFEKMSNMKMDGIEVVDYILSNSCNILGEPTTVLFDKTKLSEPFGMWNNRKFICNVDQASWFSLLSNGKAYIFNECLSGFRMHEGQQINDIHIIIGGCEDYGYTLTNAQDKGFLLNEYKYGKALNMFNANYNYVIKNNGKSELMENYHEKLQETLNFLRNKYKKISIIVKMTGDVEKDLDVINSIFNQNYFNIELLIISNEKYELIDQILGDLKKRVASVRVYYWINELGKNDNFDRAISKLKGQYFLFLECGKKLYDTEVELILEHIEKSNNAAVYLSYSNKQIDRYEYKDREAYLHILGNYEEIIANKKYYIINREYYLSRYGTFNGVKYDNICDIANICSSINYGALNVIPLIEENKRKDDKEILYRTLEFVVLCDQLRTKDYFENIFEFNNMLKNIEKRLNNISINGINKELISSTVKECIEKYYIDVGVNFKNFSKTSYIKNGAEIVYPEGITIRENTFIKEDCTLMIPHIGDYKTSNIIIGQGCDLGKRLFISASNKVVIEDNVIIASNVHITDHNHEYRSIGIPIMHQGITSFDNEVIIGRGTWIGQGCVIVGNVKIGKGCVIGANSVVTSDIPDYCVAVGQPAKIVKYYDYSQFKWLKNKEQNQIINRDNNIRPILTIGIFTYNRAAYLEQSLLKLYSEIGDTNLIEVLVCDNCSTDATEVVVKRMQEKYSNLVYHKNSENLGPMGNVQKVFELGRGIYINPHGDDDYYNPNIVWNIVNSLINNQDCSVVYTLTKSCPLTEKFGNGIDEYIKSISYYSTFITGIFVKKDEYDKIEDKNKYFDSEINQVYIQMELLKKNNKFCIIEAPLFRVDSGSHNNKENQYNFAEVFIKYYLDIISDYVGKGLSIKTYKNEKKILLDNMILPWIKIIRDKRVALRLDNLLEYYNKYYQDEEYYTEKLSIINNILEKKG